MLLERVEEKKAWDGVNPSKVTKNNLPKALLQHTIRGVVRTRIQSLTLFVACRHLIRTYLLSDKFREQQTAKMAAGQLPRRIIKVCPAALQLDFMPRSDTRMPVQETQRLISEPGMSNLRF